MIPLITAVAIAVGLTLDATLPYWGHWAANGFVFACFIAVFRRATREERRSLIVCVALATLGELFLCYVWGLYEYKYGDVPVFVPLGHSIIFVSGCRLAPKLPRLVTPVVVAIASVLVVTLAVTGTDTAGLLWFPIFLACLAIPGNRHLYGVMFALAFVVELAGTSVGSWWWFDVVPLFELRSTNPPLCAGVFYCVLDVLVLGVERIVHAGRRDGAWSGSTGADVPS